MIQLLARAFAASALLGGALVGAAHAADPLPAESRLVSSIGAPAPTEGSFTIATAEDLVVTLTDLQIPAAFTSASVVVTQADTLAGSATLAAPATTATLTLPGAVGDYKIWVFGTPGSTVSVGTFSACVAPKSAPANCIQNASLSGIISAQGSAADPTVSTLNLQLVVTVGGTYTVTFGDLNFPVALRTAASLALFQGSTPIQAPLVSGAGITLSPGTYTLLGAAQADATVKSGLYGITIAGPAGTPALLDTAVPVGLTNPAPAVNNTTAQTVTLKVSDYAFPGPLASASAVVTAGGAVLGSASAAGGAASFAAPAGNLYVWTYGSAGATPGTYSVDLAGATDLYSTAQGVSASTSSFAYAFVTPSLTAGSYQATAADLQFPSQLTALSFAIAQNGAILQQSATAAALNFTATAGPAVLLVNAQTPASGSASGTGLFDVNIQSTGGTATLTFDKTQSVSSSASLFDAQSLTLNTSQSFDATLADLKFPAAFGNLALVISRGSEVLGKIFGGGTFSFNGSPGVYQVTFVATPAAQQQFGLYGVKVVPSPMPTVTLTSNVASAAAGTTVQLTWTAANSTACTASGGNWSGSKTSTGGTEGVSLTTTATYTLTCTGPGGSATSSVTVTAVQKSSSGGGALDWGLLALAGVLLSARFRGRGFR